MRLIKENTYRYESFFNFLETEKTNSVDNNRLRYAAEPLHDKRMNSNDNKYFNKMLSLQKEYDSANDISGVCKVLQNVLTQIKNVY